MVNVIVKIQTQLRAGFINAFNVVRIRTSHLQKFSKNQRFIYGFCLSGGCSNGGEVDR